MMISKNLRKQQKSNGKLTPQGKLLKARLQQQQKKAQGPTSRLKSSKADEGDEDHVSGS